MNDFTITDDDLETSNSSNQEKELVIRPDEFVNAVEKSLSPEEKQEIKEKKERRKRVVKDAPQPVAEVDEQWKSTNLTDDELSQSKSLQLDLANFLNEHAGIKENTGKIEKLPSGIDLLDAILGGGFGCGKFSIIAGPPGTFKSALLGQIIGSSQKKFKGKLLATYNDSEETMTKKRLYELGVKYPPVNPISGVTVESVFRTIEAVCCFKEKNEMVHVPSIVAWDSIANTSTEKETNSDNNLDPSKAMGLKARILSSCLPIYISKMGEYNVTLIAVNQLRDKIDMGLYPTANNLRYLGQKTMPGGNAVQYNAFHLLLLNVVTDLKEEQWGFNGVKLKAKCVKNKFFTPNVPIELIVDFNTGISNFWTNYNFLVETKRIKPGAWGYMVSMPEVKWNGTKGCLDKYNSNDEFKAEFDKQVKEAIQVDIIDKYTNYAELEGLDENE